MIKANRSELVAILDLLGIACPAHDTIDGIGRAMEVLLAHFPARLAVVTRGAEGTIALSRDGEFDLRAPIINVAQSHPVGAGDACSAGILFGLTLGWDIHSTMELANQMGSDVAAHPSATPPLSDGTLEYARVQLRLRSAPVQG